MPNGAMHMTAPPTLQAALRDLQERLAAVVVFMSSMEFLHLLVFGFIALMPKMGGLSPYVFGLLCMIVTVVALIALFVAAAFDAIAALTQLSSQIPHSRLPLPQFSTVQLDLPTLLRPPRPTTVVAH